MSDLNALNGSSQVDKTESDIPTTEAAQPDDLHSLFDVPAQDVEDPLAGLRNDPNYAALIRDLEYIAVEARKIFEPASEEPSDRVWDKIQSELGKDQTQ